MKLLGFLFALLMAGATGVGLGLLLAEDSWHEGCGCIDCPQQAGA